MDAASRMTVLQNGVHDSYTWRKYGQKEILGARFPRSYYKCGRRTGCPARKHVQQSDADPSKLEITYFEAHTCDDPPPPSSHSVPGDPAIGSDAHRNTASLLVAPVTSVPIPSAHCYVGRPPSPPLPLHQVSYDAATTIGSNVMTTATGLLLPSASYDPVPDVTDCTPWLEQAHASHTFAGLFTVRAAAKLSLHGLPLSLENALDCDFAVPEL